MKIINCTYYKRKNRFLQITALIYFLSFFFNAKLLTKALVQKLIINEIGNSLLGLKSQSKTKYEKQVQDVMENAARVCLVS